MNLIKEIIMIVNTCQVVGCYQPQYQNYPACSQYHGRILDSINNCQGSVEFYNKGESYYELTNFYENHRHGQLVPVHYNGRDYRTSEHAFQATKFDTDATRGIFHQIINAQSAKEAFLIAQSNQSHIRSGWTQMKDEVMYRIVKSKFFTPHLANVLNKTGNRYLVEASPVDNYWGWGANHKGENKLGKILMRVRYELNHP